MFIPILCTVGLVACAQDEGPDSGSTQELRLEARDGTTDVEYCKDTDNDGVDDQCQTFPNPRPNECSVIVITIDNQSGKICETCEDANGNVLDDSCQPDSIIACTVITFAEPDCVVCAHVDGPVIYSSCIVEEPERCEDVIIYGANGSDHDGSNDGSTPPADDFAGGEWHCKICYQGGDVVYEECEPVCDDRIVPQIQCAPGFVARRLPGDCWDTCVPQDPNCDQRYCPMLNSVPDCPPGHDLVRDPSDCCGYHCEPRNCDAVLCPEIAIDCPQGYRLDTSFPNCCGQCVPIDPEFCYSDFDCSDKERCTAGDECLQPPCDDPNGACPTDFAYPDVCVGRCVPRDHQCPDPTTTGNTDPNSQDGSATDPGQTPPPDICEGWWERPQDPNGCPLPPVCVCPDGSITKDGTCQDLCYLYDAQGAPDSGGGGSQPPIADCAIQECGPDEELVYDYPYCCGFCVPKNPCDTVLCAACEPGEREVWTAGECCPKCEPAPDFCYGNTDCAGDEFCSVHIGDCKVPEECNDPDSGFACTAVCGGECLPRIDCRDDSDCYFGERCNNGACEPNRGCTISDECDPHQVCSTELDEACLPAPGCDPAEGCLGPPLCYGECVDANIVQEP